MNFRTLQLKLIARIHDPRRTQRGDEPSGKRRKSCGVGATPERRGSLNLLGQRAMRLNAPAGGLGANWKVAYPCNFASRSEGWTGLPRISNSCPRARAFSSRSAVAACPENSRILQSGRKVRMLDGGLDAVHVGHDDVADNEVRLQRPALSTAAVPV